MEEIKRKELFVAGHSLVFKYPVQEYRLIGDRVIVIYDYMAYPLDQQFQNCEAFDLNGKYLWAAEHASKNVTDSCVSFMSENPLTLWSFACFVCKLDVNTGKLIEAKFTKK